MACFASENPANIERLVEKIKNEATEPTIIDLEDEQQVYLKEALSFKSKFEHKA